MIVEMGAAPTYGPSLSLASPKAQAHQKALKNRLKKTPAAAGKGKTTALAAAAAAAPVAAGDRLWWPWVLGGLGVIALVWYLTKGGKRRGRRPFALA